MGKIVVGSEARVKVSSLPSVCQRQLVDHLLWDDWGDVFEVVGNRVFIMWPKAVWGGWYDASLVEVREVFKAGQSVRLLDPAPGQGEFATIAEYAYEHMAHGRVYWLNTSWHGEPAHIQLTEYQIEPTA